MASAITRATWTDDDGTGTTGTIINNARLQADVYDKIDAMFAGAGSYATFEFGGGMKCNGLLAAQSTKTGTYGIAATDEVILANGTFTVTLPTAVGKAGQKFTVKNIHASGTVTLATTSSQTIDGVTTQTIPALYALTVISDNANWHIL
jgi:aryl-phospho-beta-D-glucosidase BglC (GH1 family)